MSISRHDERQTWLVLMEIVESVDGLMTLTRTSTDGAEGKDVPLLFGVNGDWVL